MMMKYRSLHCCLNSPEISERFAMFSIAVPLPSGNRGTDYRGQQGVKTETISIKASALPNGLVKAKTCESTDASTYDGWYKNVYTPAVGTASKTTVKA